MTTSEIERRRCDMCGIIREEKKPETGVAPFHGWRKLVEQPETADLCSPVCLVKYATAIVNRQ